MANNKSNPLVKKGIPSFPSKNDNAVNPDQIVHPVIEKEMPEQVVSPVNTDIKQFYNPAEKIEKKQVSIYLDTDVIEAFNEFGKAEGKGAKSDLVNNFLKQVFNIRQ